uniref:Alpha-type protein kinase domain-containing protein n=1 Tax=Noctiluca scintillans TaxID=2966 RepID=A0A7S1F2U9_NOCSC
MARHHGKCRSVRVQVVQMHDAQKEFDRKSDSKVEGFSVRVRGTDKVIHADGTMTTGPRLTEGQLQHRADQGGHWTTDQMSIIELACFDFEAIVKRVLGESAQLLKAGSFMKGTDIAGESDVDLMVFGCGPIGESNWSLLVEGIKEHQHGYKIQSTNPRCIHVEARCGYIRIEFDVVAQQRQGFPPNQKPTNLFKNNRVAARAVRNIKMDFKESGEGRFSGYEIENMVLAEQQKLSTPGIDKLIDAAKAALQSDMLQRRKRPRTASRENHASECTTNWNNAIAEGQFRRVFKEKYTVKVFKDGTEAFEDSFFAEALAVVDKTNEIIDAFNKVKKFNHLVQVCRPAVWHTRDSKQRMLVEPYIVDFQQFNSNTAWVGSTDWAKTLQSLSHFSYHLTDGKMVLCDLQGAVENEVVVLTDPVLNSRDRLYGPTDLGPKGIDNFFHHHVCNSWCDSGWKKPTDTARHFNPVKSTKMI